MSTGFEAGCARGDGCETHHRYPVQTLSVVEGKPWLVWAGIGAVMLGNDISKYRPTDPWRVYRSKDAGKTW